MAEDAYLNYEGLKELMNYINSNLNNKLDKNNLPEDIVVQNDLNKYALLDNLINLVNKEQLSNYSLKTDLQDYATKDDIEILENKIDGVYHFKGNVANLEELKAITNPAQGDVYNMLDTGINAAWTGENWDEFNSFIDLSNYVKKEDVQAITVSELNKLLYSGASSVVNNLDGVRAMISNDEAEVTITLNKNLTTDSTIIIPEGKKVTLDLDGKNISAKGNVVPLWSAGGEITVKNGTISADSAAIVVREGGSVTIEDSNISSTKNNAITATEGTVTINSGNVTSQEAGVAGFKNSTIILNGGILTGIDNCPLMGNGSAAGTINDGSNMNIVMNGGKLLAHITTPGYAACGVYIPNSGSFTMNGGEIISDGAGLVMRGGRVVLNGGKIIANGAAGAVGKVGDSRQVVGSYAVVYDANSKYPATDTLELVIGKNMQLEGTDGTVQLILAEGINANITDNRN